MTRGSGYCTFRPVWGFADGRPSEALSLLPLDRAVGAAADGLVAEQPDLVRAPVVVDPAAPRAEPASRDRDRHLLGEAGRDHGPLEVAQMEVEHLAARALHHHQDANVGD